MPYPKPDHPNFCPGSNHPTGWTSPSPKEGGPEVIECAYCKRPIGRTPSGKVFPHLKTPTRTSHDHGKAIRMAGGGHVGT